MGWAGPPAGYHRRRNLIPARQGVGLLTSCLPKRQDFSALKGRQHTFRKPCVKLAHTNGPNVRLRRNKIRRPAAAPRSFLAELTATGRATRTETFKGALTVGGYTFASLVESTLIKEAGSNRYKPAKRGDDVAVVRRSVSDAAAKAACERRADSPALADDLHVEPCSVGGVEMPQFGDCSAGRERLIEQAKTDGPEAEEALNVLLMQDRRRIRGVIESLGIEPQDMGDALQSGYVGYIRAIKAYRFGTGASLWTFAKYYVKGQICDDILPFDCCRPRRSKRESGEHGVFDIEDVPAFGSIAYPFADAVADQQDLYRILSVLTSAERHLVATLATDVNQATAGRILGMTPMSVSRSRRRIAAKAKEVIGASLVA